MWTSPNDLPVGSRPGTRLMPQGFFVRGMAFALDTFLISSLATSVARLRGISLTELGVCVFIALVAYYVVAEGFFGTSLGKRMFGLRVVRLEDGRPCGIWAALVRNVVRLVDNVFFSLPGLVAIIMSPRCQRLGDRAAKTVVVSEVPEAILRAMNGMQRAAQPGAAPTDQGDVIDVDGAVVAEETLVSCPMCEAPVGIDEIVCPHCHRYVNPVTLLGEAEDLAPAPQLYACDRGHRFDAVWRLVLAGDGDSLARVRDAVSGWSPSERRLAVAMFDEDRDARSLPFVDLMADDPDAAVSALARDVGERVRASVRTSTAGRALVVIDDDSQASGDVVRDA